MAKKTCIFTVQGMFSFPIDMLRYDTCYPQQQTDVAKIEKSMTIAKRDLLKITLASQLIVNPTKDRWSSFGWTVTDVTML